MTILQFYIFCNEVPPKMVHKHIQCYNLGLEQLKMLSLILKYRLLANGGRKMQVVCPPFTTKFIIYLALIRVAPSPLLSELLQQGNRWGRSGRTDMERFNLCSPVVFYGIILLPESECKNRLSSPYPKISNLSLRGLCIQSCAVCLIQFVASLLQLELLAGNCKVIDPSGDKSTDCCKSMLSSHSGSCKEGCRPPFPPYKF